MFIHTLHTFSITDNWTTMLWSWLTRVSFLFWCRCEHPIHFDNSTWKEANSTFLAMHYLIYYISKAELNQLKEGVEYLGIHNLMCWTTWSWNHYSLSQENQNWLLPLYWLPLRSSGPCRGQIRERKTPSGAQNTFAHDTEGLYDYTKVVLFQAHHLLHCLPEYVAGRVIPNENPDGEDIWVDLGSIISFATGSIRLSSTLGVP